MNNFNLRRLVLMVVFLGSFLSGIGQSINNYVFSTNNTSSLNRSAGSIVDDIDLTSGFEVQVGGSLNNQTGALDTIPFDFWIGGARVTRFNATSNGWIGLVNQTASGTTFASNAFSPRLAPFLTVTGNNGMGTSQNGKIQTKVFGSQPNRVFVIEFLNMAINFNGTSSDSNTFQVRLYENNGAIEYVYGRMANLLALGMNYNVGFQLGATFPAVAFQHVNTSSNTASTSISTANNAPLGDILPLVGRTPGAQRSYTWTPTPVNDPGFITVSAITTTSMNLSWTDVSNEIGYAIYRSTDGGATYNFIQTVGANVTSFAATGLIANTTYDWRVYAIRESISAPGDGQGTTLPASKFFTTSGGNWSDPLIWNTLAVPSAQDSAEITTGHVVTLDVSPISCGTLIVNGTLNYWNNAVAQTMTVNGDVLVNASGTFTAGTGTGAATPHVLNIGGNTTASTLPGNLVVNGTFDMLTTASVQTVFFGTSNGTITGTGPTCEMPFISVTKGGVAPFAVDNTLEILRVITQPNATSTFTATQRLVATSGTLKISAALVFNSIHTNTVTLASANGARFWLNHGSANIGIVPTLVFNQLNLTGELRIDNGTLTLGLGNSNHFVGTTGVVRLNGGTLNLFGGLSITNIATSQLNVAGGRLTLDPQGTTNLGQFTSVLNIQSSSTFNMTSGSIEILDPHSVAGGTSILIATGGAKSVTGGTFVIGNTLAAPSGGTFATNSGFGLNIGIPIHHLTLSNNISLNTSRQCRLLAALTVNGNLTLDANAFLITGASPTGATLNVLGNILNNGIISGTSPGLTAAPGIGSLNLTGITAQNVTGSGTTNLLTLRIANATGVNFSNTGTWALENVTLESGNVTNTGTNIQVGAATYRGRITIGGLNETTASGSFSTLPSIISTFGAPSYVYGPSSTALQTGSANEMPSGAQTLFGLTINDAQGVVSNRNITVTGTLALTAGNLNMGTNNITVGLSAAAPGSLARTNGFVQLATNGSFTRWYNTSISPAFDYASGFPLSTVSSERSVLFSLNGGTFSTGGNITVRHTSIVGFTDVPAFVDGSTTINRRTNSFWTISSSPGFTPVISTTLSLRLIGVGIGAVSDVTQLKVTKATSVAGGTTQSGSGTNSRPEANRDFSNANLSGGAMFDDFHIGTNSGVNPLSPTIIAILTGNWNETATWEGGIIPDITNSATIATGVNVTIPTGITAACNGLSINAGGTLTATAGTLNSASSILIDGTMNANGTTVNVVSTATNGITINSGGTLAVSNGTVNIGTTGGGNNRLTNSGTFTVSGGTTNINGNLVIASGGIMNQSAGDINIDGNSGTAGTSVTAGNHLFFIQSNTLNCSGGTITIVDPPHGSLPATSTSALRINVTSGSLTAFTGSHTLRLGNGTSTEVGNTNGFSINTRGNVGIIPLQNVIVNGGNGSGRLTSTSFTAGTGTHIKGDLTINTNSEFRHTSTAPCALGGNIINNGTFTAAQTVVFGGVGYVVTNAQDISGTGTFRNATSSPTAEFVGATLDNGTGLTLSASNTNYRFSGVLNIAALNITTNSNAIILTSTGTLSRSTGYINGNLGKTLTVGTNIARTYEIGNATNFLPVTVTFPSVTTTGNVVIGITNGDHPQLASSCINPAKSINRFWTITNNGTVTTGGDYTFNFLAGDVDGGTVLGSAKLFSFDGAAWQAGLTPSGTTSTTYTVNGLNNYGAVAIGEITPVPTSVTISTPNTSICIGTSVTFTAVVTNGGSTPTFQWKINGTNAGTGLSTFTTSSLANNDAVTCEIVSNSPCVVAPNATSNTINMTVSPLTVGGTVAGGTTICSGSTSGVLTLSGHIGSVVRWESSTSPTFASVTTIANTTPTLTSGPLTATTFFRAVVKSGDCAEANSTSTEVTVDAPSVAGTINGNNAVCAGGAVGNLTLTGSTGTVVRWESSNVAPFTTFTPIANTTTTQDGGSPTVTTHFRAVVANGSCPSATTASFIVTVTPASAGGSVTGSQTICAGGAVTALTLSGATGNVTKWQSATNVGFTVGVADIANTTTTLTPSPSPSVTTFYRAVVQNGSCPVANSSAATITVNPAPVGGVITGINNVCFNNSPGTLTLSGHTGTIDRWQTSVSPFTAWTDISNTNTTFNPGVLTVSRAFRAVLTSASCPDAFATPLVVTVDPLAVGGTASGDQTICSGGAVTALTLSGQTGTITGWQSSANASFTIPTNISGTAGLTSFTPTSPTATTFYRAVLTSGICPTVFSSSVSITVDPAAVGGTVSGNQTICLGGAVTALTLTGQTGTISGWQSAADAGFTTPTNIAGTAGLTSFTPTSPTVTTFYRAVLTSGSCPNTFSTSVSITVDPAPVGGTASGDQTICSGGAVTALTLSGQTGTISGWQSAADAGFTTPTNIAGTAGLTSFTPTSPTVTTFYRAVLTSGSCPNVFSSAASITVTPAAVGGAVSGSQTICSGGAVTALTLSGQTGTISGWQSAADAGFTIPTNIAGTAGLTSFTPTSPTSTTFYRAVLTSGSCPNANSSSASITVDPAAVGGTVSGNQTICSGGAVTALTLSGQIGTISGWQSATDAGFTTPTNIAGTAGLTSFTPTSPTVTTFYRAVLTSGSCPNANSGAASISVDPSAVGGTITGNQTICSGDAVTALTLSGQTGTISGWQSAADAGFTTPTNIAGTAGLTSFTPTSPTSTTFYRAVLTSGSCPSAFSSTASITVNPSAVGGAVTGNQTICTGGAVTALTLSGQTGTISGWQSATDAGFTTPTNIAGTAGLTSFTPTSPSVTTFYRVVMTNGSCPSANSSSASITVTSGAVGGTVNGSSAVCTGSNTNLNLTGQTGTIVKWQFADNAPFFNNWADIANTTTSLTTAALTQTTRYRVEVASGLCPSAFSNEFEVAVTSGGIWVGVINGNWNNPANWCGGVPNATTNVVISAGTPFSPIINTGAVANNVTVDAGATLVFTGTTNSIDIRGNLVVNGTFTTTGGTVNFGAATPQSVAGITYDRLQLSGGGTKTLTGDATVTTQMDLTFGNLELSSFNLTLAGTTTGGGSTSHITTNGTGRYTINNVGAASRIFHIGSGGSYVPVTIANNGTTDNISVKVLNGVFNTYAGEVGAGLIGADVVNKTFIINEGVAGGSSLNITFQWNGTDELPSYVRSGTIVGRFNGGAWSNLTGATGVPASGANPYTFNISGVTDLGIFGLGDLDSPLPIKLVGFNAKLDDEVTHLKWATASEINNSHFEVERGTDGYNFGYIGTVNGSGNSSSRIDYKFDDKSAGELMQTNNVIYYRLKMVDFSGHIDYSKVVSVSVYGSMPFTVLNTVPNPFKSATSISVKTGSTADIALMVTDAFGREVSKSTFSPVLGANVIPVGIDNNWKSGIYFVKLTQEGETLSVKIVKQ